MPPTREGRAGSGWTWRAAPPGRPASRGRRPTGNAGSRAVAPRGTSCSHDGPVVPGGAGGALEPIFGAASSGSSGGHSHQSAISPQMTQKPSSPIVRVMPRHHRSGAHTSVRPELAGTLPPPGRRVQPERGLDLGAGEIPVIPVQPPQLVRDRLVDRPVAYPVDNFAAWRRRSCDGAAAPGFCETAAGPFRVRPRRHDGPARGSAAATASPAASRPAGTTGRRSRGAAAGRLPCGHPARPRSRPGGSGRRAVTGHPPGRGRR